jgi:signal transduction histidine kinase
MIRPWQVWLAFALGAAVVLGATGWASWTALNLDRAKAEALRKGAVEENVRLALWRMDSSLGSLIAQENGRPYFLYTSFYPAERAYTRMYNKLDANEVLVPSPLLTFASPEVKLHFQIGPTGEFSSPQVPTGNMRDLAEMSYRTPECIEKATALLTDLQKRTKPREIAARLLESGRATAALRELANVVPAQATANAAQQDVNTRYRPESQAALSQSEQVIRRNTAVDNASNSNFPQSPQARSGHPVGEGLLTPLWLDGELILARRVQANGQTWLQGCWLDWPRIRGNLQTSIQDLLPSATLEPVAGAPPPSDTRLLASLPVRLLPGPLPPAPENGISPVQVSLGIAWLALLLAAVIGGLVLKQALTLSERRGAFVSAVTHELRTPLTTFRLYTELLGEGDRVPAEKRQTYLDTLRREADRLAHLVENVLAYARLERNRPGGRAENVTLGALVERVAARLADRAAQAGMRFEAVVPGTQEVLVRADPAAVEQILFNLVDNACKYASAAPDKTIRLEAALQGAGAIISVRDFGPGVRQTKRLFQPFSKGAQEAARTAPGVGLGLALSRRLARDMGGDLVCDWSVADGACFVVTLPLAKDA